MITAVLQKFIVIARLPATLRTRVMSTLLEHCGLTAIDTEWPEENLHLSLSDRHFMASPVAMLRALQRVRARAFDLCLNRITYENDHLTLRARGDKPPEFVGLFEAIREEMKLYGIQDVAGHTAHVTLSSRSPIRLERSVHIAPMTLPVEAFELVVAGGRPYTYTTIERWSLAPRAQSDLFA